MASEFTRIFFLANFLLFSSYLFFACLTAFSRKVHLGVSHQQMVRWGQTLVLLSLLSPLGLAIVPGRQLPELPVPSFVSGSEDYAQMRSRLSRAGKGQRASAAIATTTKVHFVRAFNWLDNAHSNRIGQFGLLVWMLGLFFCAYRLGRNFSLLSLLLGRSLLLRKFGRLRVALSSQIAIPLSAYRAGIYWVVLPAQMSTQPRDFRIALQHELQHHRQGDTIWAFFVEFVVCLFYFNPAVYFWRKKIIELQEFSCDEALVGQQRVSSREYGSCLIRVAETALGSRQVYVGTTYMAAASKNSTYFKSFLRRRIEMLLDTKSRRTHRWVGVAIGTLVMALTLTLAYGAEYSGRSALARKPNAGTVPVNKNIQQISERILNEEVTRQKASEGFAIVSDPQTGRILAVANVDTKNKKTGFWALSQRQEPASVAKTLVVAQAIEEGRTFPGEIHFCENGKYKIGERHFRDWKTQGFDHLTTTDTIAVSSDICTIKIAEKLGDEGVRRMLQNFGFGPNGIASEFPAAATGQLPGQDGLMKKYLVPMVSYGQGFYTTPLEILQAYGAIANGGNLLMPIGANAADSERKVVRRALSAETADKMKRILREVVLSGTGRRNANSELYSMAGKTASSYAPNLDELEWMYGGSKKSNMAGFVGFAPVNSPRVAVYVGIRDPNTGTTGAHGSEHAAPVFRRIAEAVLQEMNVAPDTLQ